MLVICPDCGTSVSDIAPACPKCGRPIAAPALSHHYACEKQWHPGTAAVLSLFIPGAGQLYKGQLLNGLAWLVIVIIGYCVFVFPGLVLHLCCIVGAMSGDPYER